MTSGHIELSDSLPNIGFGALPQDGQTPLELTFAPRSVRWIKVFIDSTSLPNGHPNPRIGEIVINGGTVTP